MRRWKSKLSTVGHFPFLFVRRKGGTSVEKQRTRKYGAVFERQFDMSLLTAKWHQIGWREAVAARVRSVFKRLSVLWAESFAATCGQKKCFFSRTVFRSAEIESLFGLKQVKNSREL